MSILTVVLAMSSAAVAFSSGCLGFLLTTAAVNSNAEEAYWESFWQDTPTTEGVSEDASVESRGRDWCWQSLSDLEKAA